MSNNTGTMIAELRKEAGYTQKSLAEALHITDKAISKWERGICLPDSSLLPKLSLLLDADIEFLLSHKGVDENNWIGLIDLTDYDIDISVRVYDKPLVYYLLSHFLLLNITDIYIRTTEENQKYLSDVKFKRMGFMFTFDFSELPNQNVMILNAPCFLFGSDLTRQFQGAMVSQTLIKLVPYKQDAVFLFCPAEDAFMYLRNPAFLYEEAAERTLGRGMINVNMVDIDAVMNVAGFVRFYQNNTGVLIGSLEEIADRREI